MKGEPRVRRAPLHPRGKEGVKWSLEGLFRGTFKFCHWRAPSGLRRPPTKFSLWTHGGTFRRDLSSLEGAWALRAPFNYILPVNTFCRALNNCKGHLQPSGFSTQVGGHGPVAPCLRPCPACRCNADLDIWLFLNLIVPFCLNIAWDFSCSRVQASITYHMNYYFWFESRAYDAWMWWSLCVFTFCC